MEPGTLIEKLAYLSKYLQEYRDRISSLEGELERLRSDTSTKDELGVLTEGTRRLEAEKAALQQELVALKEASKVKEETPKIKGEIPHMKVEPSVNPTRPPALSAPNTVLADARQTFRQEHDRNEILQAKCTNLETKVKESAYLAAKAFIERAEGEKALDKMRVEATEMKKKIKDLEKTCDELNAENAAGAVLIEANEALMGKLRVKYDIVKAEKKETRTDSEGLEAEIAAVNEKFSAVKAKYKTVKTEKEDLQQVGCVIRASLRLHEWLLFIEIVESLEVEVKANAGAAEDHPPFATLSPACHLDTNLHAFLAKDATAKSVLNHALYLPKRVSKTADVHFIAFGPSHRYDRVTSNWVEGSDLTSLHGRIRELFVKWVDSILYVGTYKCHDLRSLCPAGTTLPSGISEREIADAALGLPRPQGYVNIIKQCYPDGNIKVVAMGLQCVRFNKQLYDSLHKRFTQDLTAQTKCKAEDESNRDAKRRKD
ncbi:hypothetical protein DFH09DRAFT_1340770 [Mycena vulgaris]|nr:hypothetical protein DFH09DRAFT_1340770 [Mycena vulgaris]